MTVIGILLPLLILLGLHYALYATVVQSFQIGSFLARLAMALVPLALTLSFVASAILHRLQRNVFTAAYALLSSVWIGIFIQLLMAVAMIWLILLAGKVTGLKVDPATTCSAAFAFALVASAYGVWHARQPRVTTVEVEIKGLPREWDGATIVQLSDVHLGTIRRTAYLQGIVTTTNALHPSLILITGDLFDGMGNDLEPFVEPLNTLQATHGVFFVTGNHEGYLGLEKPLAVLSRTQIRVLNNEVVEVDGLQLVGISFPEHDQGDNASRAFDLGDKIDPARPSVLMFHTPTEVENASRDRGEQQGRTYFSPDTRFEFARAHGIDLQLSGHTHQGQVFPFTLLTRWIYNGYHHGLHRMGRFQIYITSGSGTWGPPMRTAGTSEIVAVRLRKSPFQP